MKVLLQVITSGNEAFICKSKWYTHGSWINGSAGRSLGQPSSISGPREIFFAGRTRLNIIFK
ncbi:hypothetical protein CY34DRAFT_632049 [Suillus luteus UH-Slu-Lm8-n1]|uniref:Uncharacterized protein n=1 Tax=Suillus luteus UH-Slu-Lm8-n1 TaxID=930992 RepID=A0A0D0AED3_9AGAM|nr:hypothetical protein CY34DRAFT_632049 [Suillus luteus UH-Slu-Lm8-n1]